MSVTLSTAALVQQDGLAEARQQIREQVRRDVERALREAQAARAEARAAQEAQGELRVPAPPMPPDIPGIGQAAPRVYVETGQPPVNFNDIPPRVEEVALGFFLTVAVIFIGTPLARAFARRLDRKAVAPATSTPDVVSRLDRIEQAVDAIALEVERISEGQRYVTKLMSETRALPSPNEAAAHELRMAELAPAEQRAVGERKR